MRFVFALLFLGRLFDVSFWGITWVFLFLVAEAFTMLGEKTTLLSPGVIVKAGVPCCRYKC